MLDCKYLNEESGCYKKSCVLALVSEDCVAQCVFLPFGQSCPVLSFNLPSTSSLAWFVSCISGFLHVDYLAFSLCTSYETYSKHVAVKCHMGLVFPI